MIRAKTRLECTVDLRESGVNPVCGSEMQRLTVRFVNCRQGNKLQWLPVFLFAYLCFYCCCFLLISEKRSYSRAQVGYIKSWQSSCLSVLNSKMKVKVTFQVLITVLKRSIEQKCL